MEPAGTYSATEIWSATYAFHMPDGSLRSLQNAEVRPDDAVIRQMKAQGGRLTRIRDNPKIVLDDGRVVYGCQVWWGPVRDATSPSA